MPILPDQARSPTCRSPSSIVYFYGAGGVHANGNLGRTFDRKSNLPTLGLGQRKSVGLCGAIPGRRAERRCGGST